MRSPWEELEPASRDAVDRQHQAVRRVELLATVVFAAAMAVLVVLLVNFAGASVPVAGNPTDLLKALWPAAGACALGFLVLLSIWLLYHLQFHYLTQSSGLLLLLHALLLPSALLIPFSTALLNTLALTRQAVLLFDANVLLIQILLLLMWRHAVKGGLLFGSNVPARVVRRMRLLLRAGVSAMLVVLGLAMLSSPAGLGALIAVLAAQIAVVTKGGYTLDLRAGKAPSPSM